MINKMHVYWDGFYPQRSQWLPNTANYSPDSSWLESPSCICVKVLSILSQRSPTAFIVLSKNVKNGTVKLSLGSALYYISYPTIKKCSHTDMFFYCYFLKANQYASKSSTFLVQKPQYNYRASCFATPFMYPSFKHYWLHYFRYDS